MVRHTGMDSHDNPTKHEPDEGLSVRLHSVAERFAPDTDAALDAVRGRSTAKQRQRTGMSVIAAAASVALVAGAVFAFSGNDAPAPQLLPLDPASGGAAAAPDQATPAEQFDATLVMYRVSDGTGQFDVTAELHTRERTYLLQSTLPDGATPDDVRFGPEAMWTRGYGDSWSAVDRADTTDPLGSIEAILGANAESFPTTTALDPADEDSLRAFAEASADSLVRLIESGTGSPEQVRTVVELLGTLDGVEVDSVDGLGVIRFGQGVATFFYAPDTGKPVRWLWEAPDSDLVATREYIAVMGVDSSRFVDPETAQKIQPFGPTSTTTTVPGDLPVIEQPGAPEPIDPPATTTTVVAIAGS